MEEQLPERWVETTLGEIRFDLAKGIVPGNFPEQFFELYSVPNFGLGIPEILQGKEIKSNKQVIDSDTVLLCKINPRLNRAWVVGNFSEYTKIASTEWIPFFSVSMMVPMYLCYYLRQTFVRDYFAANASGVGGSLMRINDTIVAHYPFPLAPLPEQQRIVAAIEQQFTRLDSAVASLKSAQARIKQYCASLLKSAVEGEMTKEWRAEHPADETGEQLLKRILVERRKRWEEGELAKMREKGSMPKDDNWKQDYKEPQKMKVDNFPPIPENWFYSFLEPLLTISKKGMITGPFGSLLKKHEHRLEGVPVLGIENIMAMRFVTGNKIFITEDKALELSQYEALPGDILISRSGTVGEVCVVPENLGEARISTNLMRISLTKGGMLPQFFCLLFNGSPFVLNQVSRLCKGSTRDFLSQAILSRIIFPLPPIAEQEQIIAEVEARLSNIAKLEETTENNLKRAENERQSILQEAFAGRLVPQDPDDEPASVLLERIREERKKREEVQKTSKESRKGGLMGSVKKRRVGKSKGGQQEVDLYKTLVEAGQALAPDELFKRVDLKIDEQPKSVEVFYKVLDVDEKAGWIEVLRPDMAQVLLEARESSAESQEDAEVEDDEIMQPQEAVLELDETPFEPGQDEDDMDQLSLWDA